MASLFKKPERLLDPLGPGSPAWEAFDRAVGHHIRGEHSQYGLAVARVRRLVAHHNGSVAAWMVDLQVRLQNPEPGDEAL